MSDLIYAGRGVAASPASYAPILDKGGAASARGGTTPIEDNGTIARRGKRRRSLPRYVDISRAPGRRGNPDYYRIREFVSGNNGTLLSSNIYTRFSFLRMNIVRNVCVIQKV